MSEHLSVNGECNFFHSPMDEEWGFVYCNRCKIICHRLTIEFHQRWFEDWVSVICPKCKKTIWVSTLKRKTIKDDKKCFICENLTNHYDCSCYGSGIGDNKLNYFCCRKCEKVYDKIINRRSLFLDELKLCESEQNIEDDFQRDIKIVKEIMKNG